MKTFLTILIVLLVSNFGFAQAAPQEASTLTYKKEIPATNTYKIIKNTTGQALSTEVLEHINLHRRFDGDYTWVVNNSIEILIYVVGKTEPAAEPKKVK